MMKVINAKKVNISKDLKENEFNSALELEQKNVAKKSKSKTKKAKKTDDGQIINPLNPMQNFQRDSRESAQNENKIQFSVKPLRAQLDPQSLTQMTTVFDTQANKQLLKQMKQDIISYGEPQVSISYRGKDSLSILGGEKIEDFSGECQSGLQYRDYKDAFSNTLFIDENSVDISKRSKTIRQANSERKDISYKLSEEDLKKQKYIHLMEEKKEEERIKRLNTSDNNAFSSYDAIHQRMLGR